MNENLIGKLADAFQKQKGVRVETIETHISWLILAEDYVYKMKKDVKFSFLDFSHLDNRKFYCEQELKLNRRLAPEMYLDVLPVTETQDNELMIGDGQPGHVIDYAVKMKRLNNENKMHILLEKGGVKSSHVVKLAEKIARFHQHTQVIDAAYDEGFLKQRFNDIFSVKDFFENHQFREELDLVNEVIAFSDRFINEYSEAFKRRYTNQMVRDCHGDLHSDNIFIYDDPVVFDCIEFNKAFRQIDVLNEVAFFCMDMEYLHHDDYSDIFMEKYLELFPCMESEADEAIFVYYKLFRANVKAKVNAIRASQEEDNQAYEDNIVAMKNYMKLMKRYMAELQ